MGTIHRGCDYPLHLFAMLAAGGSEKAALRLCHKLQVRPRRPVRGICRIIGDEYLDALERFQG